MSEKLRRVSRSLELFEKEVDDRPHLRADRLGQAGEIGVAG